MTPLLRPLIVLLFVLAVDAREAAAQIPGCDVSKQFRLELVTADHWRLTGEVEIECGGQKFFANQVDVYTTENLLTADGNVVFQTADARISATRVEFNLADRTGVFHEASGIASLGERADRSMFGTLEPDIYFYGDTIDLLGSGRYKLTAGGFTTCVQPTPRWEVVTGSATISVGDYAILRNAVIRVKNVPVFYLPILYYPIQDDDRATGFLLPTYGNSTYLGQSVSNAFFWAMSRSQDVTIFHDWMFSRGQGVGAEYRYQASATSAGQMRTRWLGEKASVLDTPSGPVDTPERRSFDVTGNLTQALPGRLTARARVDYFSDIEAVQVHNYDVYRATNTQRSIDASLSGSWGSWNVGSHFRRTELFYTADQSVVAGQVPGLMASLSSRKIGPLPLFVSLQGDAGRSLYEERRFEAVTDRSMNRVDLVPQLRAPLLNAPYLSVTGNFTYRYTWYSQSLDEGGAQVPVGLARQYAQMGAEVVGPVFSRVFTPNNRLADRLKHVIEPSYSIQRTTSIDNQDQVALIGSSYDYVVGGATRLNYALTNRVLVRKDPDGGAPAAQAGSAPRELLSLTVQQSYYTDDRASQFDRDYASSYGGRRPSRLSPLQASLRASPTATISNAVRAEFDPEDYTLQSLSAGVDVRTQPVETNLTWSRQRLGADRYSNVLRGGSRLRLRDGRVGGSASFYWDVTRQTLLEQRWIGYYNAQCCGIAFEYQAYSFANTSLPIPSDRRFNISFTLAGIGTFSNLFGSFGGSRY
ncbi:MAG: putative LPS assembly protein LptD [Vicinamibacterales bacterium]|nr:putative LPS assembly protein LptD [Vicinamibacterales bacterium]